jgi:RES domain-containing protein
MSQRVYRVCRAIHARLDGEGAKRVGGRWNSPGRAVVYMADSISLAVLENLVHMSKEDFPVGYVSVSASIPDEVSILSEDDVKKHLPDAGPRELGDHWVGSRASAVLRVRSAVIPDEFNFLLNPRHREFARIIAKPATPFVFDERLFGSRYV